MTQNGPRDIAPPNPTKRALKVNCFEYGRGIGSALLPLFPYHGDGDIVPCMAVFRGAAENEGSVFEHTNSVDEVAICFGAQGTSLKVGQVFVGDKKHTVGSFLPKDSSAYVIITVTQRQAEAGVEQRETWSVICEKCSTPLIEHHFESKPDADQIGQLPPGYSGALPTILGSCEGARKLNSSVESRTCKHCGHLHAPFRIGTWHWDVVTEQSWCVDQALHAYADRSGVEK